MSGDPWLERPVREGYPEPTSPPAAESGTPAPGEAEYERDRHGPTTFANLAHRMGVVIDPALPGPEVRRLCVALVREAERNMPGPGEGDLRGEVNVPDDWRGYCTLPTRAEWLAAVEQRTLAEQKVARVEALCDAAEVARPTTRYGEPWGYVTASAVRAALADPEADR